MLRSLVGSEMCIRDSIDMAHHDTTANRALRETMRLDEAVESVSDKLRLAGQLEDTLIIVTADHSHTMSFAGYPKRGNDITGLSGMLYDDGLPYTTLSYANGLGFYERMQQNGTHPVRQNLTNVDVSKVDFLQASAAFHGAETHGGDDVAIFAQGPWAHLFHR